jgi:AraC-type transcriptional regulator N-terminus
MNSSTARNFNLGADWLQELREELARRIAAHVGAEQKRITAVRGLTVHRRTAQTPPCSMTYEPSLILTAQGRKRVELGGQTFTYGPSHYLLASVALPVMARVIEASEEAPCLALSLKLEMSVVRDLLSRGEIAVAPHTAKGSAIAIGEVTVELLHSQGGGLGWATVLKTANVRGIVAFEPGSGFLFPEGEVPESLPSSGGTLSAIGVPMAEFMKLTKIPIIIFYGDFIPEKPTENPGQDGWRVRLEMARKWRDTVNHHGGDVTILHLPEVGVRGNTHFPFSDTNNKQVADLMSKFLSEKKLD